ncbi:MAG: dihydroorotate dehydrogenase electron transfer subunit [Gammaproteobacteria bacterium]|nr:dihydroorotate dehydrogenase electron transfer subunit [Gammaproteobacteria bacterium]NND53730.1 dihydroorotate dehydrogenase electron transfer subunit [Gammaproteobacteria bacterium]
MSPADKPHRGTIHIEDAAVIDQVAHPGEQFVLSVHAPECAQHATAGSFAHLQCDPDIPMRRPISIMGADPESGQVDFLYKIVGHGLRSLGHKKAGDTISVLGPIGNGFTIDDNKPRKLMVGGGVGVPPMLFLANQLARAGTNLGTSLVLMGSEVPFPFTTVESHVGVGGIATDATHALESLEQQRIPSRLASLQGYDGVHNGYVTDLTRGWLAFLSDSERAETQMFACGPEPMLEAAAQLAAEFNVSCQLCLEEYMACAVGGCAGCTVPVHLEDGVAMKRVCVDGPVFEAKTIYPSP